MALRWPWKRAPAGRLVVASDPDRLAWACADAQGRVTRCGLELRGSDDEAGFARRIRALGLPADDVVAVLPLAAVQLLRIEAPAVKPDELRAAARWHIKGMVEGRVDELTLDVMVVGSDEPRPNRHLFVAAARSELIRATAERLQAAGLKLAVVDIAETTQRNVQTALAQAAGLGAQATASLVRHGAQALLTISAGGELYLARRLDWDAGARVQAQAPVRAQASPAMLDFDSADIVDYGAEPDSGGATDTADAPQLIVELQRSFDLWERSHPDLPLGALWLDAGDETEALSPVLGDVLGLRTGRHDPAEVLPGWAAAAPLPAVRDALLPIAGALLRAEARRP